MELDFEHMTPVLSILVPLFIFLSGALWALLRWSFNASIKINRLDMETNFKKWMKSMETNIKADIKELYSDKVNQMEVEKDIERLQGDVKEMKKTIESLRTGG